MKPMPPPRQRIKPAVQRPSAPSLPKRPSTARDLIQFSIFYRRPKTGPKR